MNETVEGSQNKHEKEFKAIASMIKFAEEQGFLVEVIWSAMNEIMNTTSSNPTLAITNACNNALHEWDI